MDCPAHLWLRLHCWQLSLSSIISRSQMQLDMLLWLNADRSWVHGCACCGLDQASIHVSCMGAKTVRTVRLWISCSKDVTTLYAGAEKPHTRGALTCCRSRNALCRPTSAAGAERTQLKRRCGLCNGQAAADEAPMGREDPPGPALCLKHYTSGSACQQPRVCMIVSPSGA